MNTTLYFTPTSGEKEDQRRHSGWGELHQSVQRDCGGAGHPELQDAGPGDGRGLHQAHRLWLGPQGDGLPEPPGDHPGLHLLHWPAPREAQAPGDWDQWQPPGHKVGRGQGGGRHHRLHCSAAPVSGEQTTHRFERYFASLFAAIKWVKTSRLRLNIMRLAVKWAENQAKRLLCTRTGIRWANIQIFCVSRRWRNSCATFCPHWFPCYKIM